MSDRIYRDEMTRGDIYKDDVPSNLKEFEAKH